MCGRYSLFTGREELAGRFDLEEGSDVIQDERYNIAPSQEVIAVVKGKAGNKAGLLKWGLVPSWADDPKIGYRMINARSETVDQKPSFAKLLKRRRCLIPADGFYEWKKEEDGGKQPFRFQLKTKAPFAFAGLWDRWERDGEMIHSCTIITTEANEVVRDIHDRMPVILTAEAEAQWLTRELDDAKTLTDLLRPLDPELMEAYPVSQLVNSPKNDVKEIVNSL